MTFIQTWTKHLEEQILNDKPLNGFESMYDEATKTILSELFFMLVAAIGDEDKEAVDAYCYVIRDFIVPTHYSMFTNILTDAKDEADYTEDYKYELLQEEPRPQADEGKRELPSNDF